jgi:hypothetical protein
VSELPDTRRHPPGGVMPDNANFVAFVAAPISCLTPPSYAGWCPSGQ